MVKKYEQEALARSLTEVANINLSDARNAIKTTLPQFVNRYKTEDPEKFADLTPENFELDGKKVSFLLFYAAKQQGITPDTIKIKNLFYNQKDYQQNFVKNQKSVVYNEDNKRYAKMGTELEGALAPYVNAQKLQDIKGAYKGNTLQYDPSKRYPGDKNKMAQYQAYLTGVRRANEILKYLNDNHISMTIDNDSDHPSQLVAMFPEYGNMKVTLMANHPEQIGQVNTWENQYGYNLRYDRQNKRYTYETDPKKFNAAVILDTVLNPRDRISGINRFRSNSKNKNMQLVKQNIPELDANGNPIKDANGNIKVLPNVNIFVTSQTNHLQTMDHFVEKVKKSEIQDTPDDLMKEFADETGIEDDSNDLVISQKDKNHDIMQRGRSDWNPINVDSTDENGNVLVSAKDKIAAERKSFGLYQTIYNQAQEMGLKNVVISKNSKGVYKYFYKIENPKTHRLENSYGIIGGYIKPEKDGTFKLKYNGKLKGYSVPGMRAYIDDDTGNLRVKKFGSILRERVRKTMLDEINNPRMRDSVKAYTALDSLYTTDGYSTVIKNKGTNDPRYEKALIKTLQKRVRLSDDVLSIANALNEDPNHVKMNDKNMEESPQNERNRMLANENLRTIPKKWQKYVDREMTGIGKTMGGSLFLGNKTIIMPDGSLSAPDDVTHAKTALHEMGVFNWDKYDPADRNIMAFNQAIRNVPMSTVNVAMMTMSGWTENDACVITKKYADDKKHWIKDAKTGEMRPPIAGDKISDYHGNKSTISLVIDPDDKDPVTSKKYAREEAIARANPDLEVIVNPYSSISRLNTGSVREMQERGGMTHLNTPKEFPDIDLSNITMGKMTYVTCVDQQVTEKTVVYDDDMYKKGKARRVSHQGSAVMASADLQNTLKAVYKDNPNLGWGKFFDDIHLLGYDIDKEHHVGKFDYNNPNAVVIKLPNESTIAKTQKLSDRVRGKTINEGGADDFTKKLNSAYKEAIRTHAPVMMEVPGTYTDKSGQKTNKIVVPYQQMMADKRRIEAMGTTDNKATSSWKNSLHKIYRYAAGIDLDKNGNLQTQAAMNEVENLSRRVIKKEFSNNHNVIKDEVYSRPMRGSATAVLTPDPTLDIDEIEVGPKTFANMCKTDPKLKNGKHGVAMFRDPQLRDGGLRFFKVKPNKRLTGVAMNPVNTKSFDADFDGDTMGIYPIADEKAQEELKRMYPSNNLIDYATGKKGTFLEDGLELTGSLYRQGKTYELDDLNSMAVDADTARQVVKDGFDSNAAYGIGIDATDKKSYLKSISYLIESGAKGSCARDKDGNAIKDKNGLVTGSKAMENVEKYYDGKRTDQDMHDSMVALSVKADVVGPAGASQQKLLWVLRNTNPKAALDVTYNTTNGALQAKHDAEDARQREKQIVGPLPKILSGQKPYANQYDPNQRISTRDFKDELDRCYNIELGMDLSKETIESLAQSLDNGNGEIMDNSERLEQADPLDVIAYNKNSILSHLNSAMKNDRTIATGKYTKLFEMPEELCSDHVLGYDYEAKQRQAQKQAQTQTQAAMNSELPQQNAQPNQDWEVVEPDENEQNQNDELSSSPIVKDNGQNLPF